MSVCECKFVEPAHQRVCYKVNVYADNEMTFWNTSWLQPEIGGYVAFGSSSTWWNKLLNISLLGVLTLFTHTHTHIGQHCANAFPSLLCINSSTHASQNPSGPVLRRQPGTLSALADLNRFELRWIVSRFRRMTLDAKCKALLSHVVLNGKRG